MTDSESLVMKRISEDVFLLNACINGGNAQIPFSELSAYARENAFLMWVMKHTKQNSEEKYDEKTASLYVFALKNFVKGIRSSLPSGLECPDNLFECSSFEQLSALDNLFKGLGEAYDEANLNGGTGKRNYSNGIALYLEFAEEVEKGKTEKGFKAQEQDSKENCGRKTFPKLSPRGSNLKGINTILYGAPGTGKTYSTVQKSLEIIYKGNSMALNSMKDSSGKYIREKLMSAYQNLVDSGRIAFTTFHQSYGYEDFVQGLRPDPKSEHLAFKPVDGIFKIMADNAMKHEDDFYVLIIDEINRGNISKIFGELITLLEIDKRWGEVNQLSVTLPSGEPFAVPNNLFIIGTMNSADKSISAIDAALRRRFEFQEITPDEELVPEGDLRNCFHKLNERLEYILETGDLLIGHSYFMGKTTSDLVEILNKNIIPLLYEYFYDDKKKVQAILEYAKPSQIELETKGFGRIRVKNK